MYTFFSEESLLFLYLTSSSYVTFVPRSVTSLPLTVISPFFICSSASLLEHTPLLAINLLRRIPAVSGSAALAPLAPLFLLLTSFRERFGEMSVLRFFFYFSLARSSRIRTSLSVPVCRMIFIVSVAVIFPSS